MRPYLRALIMALLLLLFQDGAYAIRADQHYEGIVQNLKVRNNFLRENFALRLKNELSYALEMNYRLRSFDHYFTGAELKERLRADQVRFLEIKEEFETVRAMYWDHPQNRDSSYFFLVSAGAWADRFAQRIRVFRDDLQMLERSWNQECTEDKLASTAEAFNPLGIFAPEDLQGPITIEPSHHLQVSVTFNQDGSVGGSGNYSSNGGNFLDVAVRSILDPNYHKESDLRNEISELNKWAYNFQIAQIKNLAQDLDTYVREACLSIFSKEFPSDHQFLGQILEKVRAFGLEVEEFMATATELQRSYNEFLDTVYYPLVIEGYTDQLRSYYQDRASRSAEMQTYVLDTLGPALEKVRESNGELDRIKNQHEFWTHIIRGDVKFGMEVGFSKVVDEGGATGGKIPSEWSQLVPLLGEEVLR